MSFIKMKKINYFGLSFCDIVDYVIPKVSVLIGDWLELNENELSARDGFTLGGLMMEFQTYMRIIKDYKLSGGTQYNEDAEFVYKIENLFNKYPKLKEYMLKKKDEIENSYENLSILTKYQ